MARATSAPVRIAAMRATATFRSFIIIRAADELASQMLNVCVGWYVYAAANDPLTLAYVGLAQFLPNLGLSLIGGHAADRFDKRQVIGLSLLAQGLCLAAFSVWSIAAPPAAGPVYLLLLIVGSARAFFSPAISAMLPHVVGEEELPHAVAVTSSIFQVCTIAGPAVGGLVYAVSGPAAFAVAAGFYGLAIMQAYGLRAERPRASSQRGKKSDCSVLAGIRFVRESRLLFALISLDLFAVLLGGVTALLPIYAKDILAVGPVGLGCLRCAPGVGAAIVGLVLARRTIKRGAGRMMLFGVAGFGLATVVFGLSSNFWLSLFALAAVGGFDMVSMVVRQTMMQLATPNSMRGRVSAVNGIFIGASSELGEFESGLAAALLGAVPAAVLGGLGTLAVLALWAIFFPELRRSDSLSAQTSDGDT
jgi:MFS family permease